MTHDNCFSIDFVYFSTVLSSTLPPCVFLDRHDDNICFGHGNTVSQKHVHRNPNCLGQALNVIFRWLTTRFWNRSFRLAVLSGRFRADIIRHINHWKILRNLKLTRPRFYLWRNTTSDALWTLYFVFRISMGSSQLSVCFRYVLTIFSNVPSRIFGTIKSHPCFSTGQRENDTLTRGRVYVSHFLCSCMFQVCRHLVVWLACSATDRPPRRCSRASLVTDVLSVTRETKTLHKKVDFINRKRYFMFYIWRYEIRIWSEPIVLKSITCKVYRPTRDSVLVYLTTGCGAASLKIDVDDLELRIISEYCVRCSTCLLLFKWYKFCTTHLLRICLLLAIEIYIKVAHNNCYKTFVSSYPVALSR